MGQLEQLILSWAAQGTPYLLSAISWVVTVFLYKRNEGLQKTIDDQRNNADARIRELYEKRLSEFGVSAAAIERNTNIFSELRASVADQSEAINHLVTSVTEMARDIQANRSRWHDRGEQMMRSLDTLQQRLDVVQNNLRRGG